LGSANRKHKTELDLAREMVIFFLVVFTVQCIAAPQENISGMN
jgi:hypothetical protein